MKNKKSMVYFMIAVLFASFVSAGTYTYSKDGNQFSSSSGNYATSTHCAGTACTWISGNQAIVGTYNGGLYDGTLCYTFSDVSSSVSSASLKIEWPAIYGKGLHSQGNNGKGNIKVNGNSIASLVTNTGKCSPTNDYYAHACGTWSLEYQISPSYMSSTPKICITTDNFAVWDISKITLKVIGSEPVPTCSSSTTCVQTYVSGSTTYYCRDMGSGYKWYTTSQIQAKCDQSDEKGKKIYCGYSEYICNDNYNFVGCNSNNYNKATTVVKGTTYTCKMKSSTSYRWG